MPKSVMHFLTATGTSSIAIYDYYGQEGRHVYLQDEITAEKRARGREHAVIEELRRDQ